jgi:hypothetical protein
MKKAGVIILIIGLAVTMFTGLNFVTSSEKKGVEKLSISFKNNYALSWSPVIGSVVMVIGAAFFAIGIKVKDRLLVSLTHN